MKKQTIAVDIDDVLASSADEWVRHTNELWGTNLTIEDFDENWGAMWQVDHDEMKRRRDILFENRVVRDFPPQQQAMATLKQLSDHYRLIVTSSRNSDIRQDTLDWLNEHYADVFEEIHLSGIYDTGKEDAHTLTKRELLERVGADYLIDDQPKHCIAAAEAGLVGILFGEYAWNRDVELPSGVVRCKDWPAVQAYFDTHD
jgi:5'(3')-deoxyribonucleotidase